MTTTNANIDFQKVDYSDGIEILNDMYKPSELVTCSFDDFLKLPKSDGYLNNQNRVPNDFTNVVDVTPLNIPENKYQPIVTDDNGSNQ